MEMVKSRIIEHDEVVSINHTSLIYGIVELAYTMWYADDIENEYITDVKVVNLNGLIRDVFENESEDVYQTSDDVILNYLGVQFDFEYLNGILTMKEGQRISNSELTDLRVKIAQHYIKKDKFAETIRFK
jgi:hypothetical protein